MIKGYFKFIVLPEELRKQHKIKSLNRLDCIAYSDAGLIELNGLMNFVNVKGQLVFYPTRANQFVKAHSSRIAQWALTGGSSLNFSSLFMMAQFPQFAWGCPNSRAKLKSGEVNPMAAFKNDGYLFLLNSDFTEVEVLILPHCAHIIELLFQQLLDGNFDEEIEAMRGQAKPFFNYSDANNKQYLLIESVN
jgi:hypothetical protein